jgi:hypothetical protein
MLRIFFTVTISIFFALNITAQTNGILPFTGIKYFREGVWSKEIEVTANGNTMVSNKIPVNTDFDIKLLEPRGFFPDAAGKYYPGIKVLLLKSNKKDTLGYSPNIFSKNESLGFTNASFKSLTVTLGFHNKLTVGDTIYQYITFFDTKSKNKLLIEFPVIIADSLQTGEWIATASGTKGYNAAACGGIKLKKIEAYLDSTYYPKSLYHNLRSAEMLGITTEEISKGKFETWVFDEQMKEIPFIKEAKQYAAKTFTGKDEINILVQVPLNPDDTQNKKYAVRYRWQSADGKKVIDIINKFW